MKKLIKTTLGGAVVAAAALGAQAQSANDDVGVSLQIDVPYAQANLVILGDLVMELVDNPASSQAATAQTDACISFTGGLNTPAVDLSISSRNASGADNRFFLYSQNADAYLHYSLQVAFWRVTGFDGGVLPDKNLTDYSVEYAGFNGLSPRNCDAPNTTGNIVIRASVLKAYSGVVDYAADYGENFHPSASDFTDHVSAGQSFDFSDVLTVTVTPSL